MKTKQFFLSVLFALMASVGCLAQQNERLTVLLLPSSKWMADNGLAEKKAIDDSEILIYKYEDVAGVQEMSAVLNTISKLLQGRGFMVKSTEVYKEQDFDDLMEELRKDDADFNVDVSYSVKKMGPKNMVSWNVEATDVATYDAVARLSGELVTMEPLSLALRKDVSAKSDEFLQQMTTYIQDMRENGRKIRVVCRSKSGGGVDFLGDGIDGKPIKDHFQQWFSEHAINGEVKFGRLTSKSIEVKRLRIPYYNSQGEPINAQDWGKTILQDLRDATGLKIDIDKYQRQNVLNLTFNRE